MRRRQLNIEAEKVVKKAGARKQLKGEFLGEIIVYFEVELLMFFYLHVVRAIDSR